jgi:tRNA threonylcarbamoyl adenosine modification protein (Sua5/YciO/YrdC/YwlC family)
MTKILHIHPDNPSDRLLNQAIDMIHDGAVIAYPTDSGYALGGRLDDKAINTRLRQIRQLKPDHHLTIMCHDLTGIAHYAQLDNAQFRLIKAATPGAYTFILKASKAVPKLTMHPKKATIGLRIPNHLVALSLLKAYGQPLLSCSFLQNNGLAFDYIDDIPSPWAKQIDLVIDSGRCINQPTSMIDLSGSDWTVLREGAGSLEAIGLQIHE